MLPDMTSVQDWNFRALNSYVLRWDSSILTLSHALTYLSHGQGIFKWGQRKFMEKLGIFFLENSGNPECCIYTVQKLQTIELPPHSSNISHFCYPFTCGVTAQAHGNLISKLCNVVYLQTLDLYIHVKVYIRWWCTKCFVRLAMSRHTHNTVKVHQH